MKPTAPMSLLAAGYRTRERAVRDFDTVWMTRHHGEFHHLAIALLGADPGGRLRVERNSSTAKHLLWGGALLGGGLFTLAPAAGAEVLAAVGRSGAGAVIAHVQDTARAGQIVRARQVLEDGAWALLVVVVNRPSDALRPLLEHADRSASIDMAWGELEEELCQDFTPPLPETIPVAS